jgi:hypothetical protein
MYAACEMYFTARCLATGNKVNGIYISDRSGVSPLPATKGNICNRMLPFFCAAKLC